MAFHKILLAFNVQQYSLIIRIILLHAFYDVHSTPVKLIFYVALILYNSCWYNFYIYIALNDSCLFFLF